jgi:VCBS repeat-containing protein
MAAGEGSVAIDAGTGEYTYTPGSDFQSLAAGETTTVSFDVTIADDNGGSDTETVTVTITGTNDAPVAVADVVMPDVPLLDGGFETPNIAGFLYNNEAAGGAWTFEDRSGLTDNATGFTSGNPGAPEGSQVAFLQYSQATAGVISQSFTAVTGEYVLEFDAARRGNSNDNPMFQVVLDGVVQATVETPDIAYTHHSVVIQIQNDGLHTLSLVSVAGVDSDETTFLDNIALTGANTDFNGSVAYSDSDVDTGAILTYALNAPVAGVTLGSDGSYSVEHSDPAYASLAKGEVQNVVANYTVTDQHVASDTSTLTVNVTGTNDAPTVVAGGTAAYVENDAATVIDAALTLSDVDDTNLEGASVAITGGFVAGEDSLSFTNQNGIIGSYTGATGILALSGTATVAQYQAAMASVSYANSSDDPDTSDRTVSFGVNDGDVDSAVAFSTVTVAAVNDGPTILGATSPGSISVNDGGVWDTAANFSGASTNYTAPGEFFSGDQITFDITVQPQGGFRFTLLEQLTNAQLLQELVPGPVGVMQTETYTVTGDVSLYYNIFAVYGGNPGWDIDASVDSGGLDVNEDTSGLFTGLSIGDPDAGTGDISVTLDVANGDLALTSIAGLTQADADGTDGTLAFSGSLADVNAALAGLEYTGDADFNGQDLLNIAVDDGGNTGTGGVMSDAKSVVINVEAVNDAPVAVGDTGAVSEDEPGIIIDLLGNDSDVDTLDLLSIDSFDFTGTDGAVTDNGNGTITYDPSGAFENLNNGENSTDSFSYTVTDGNGGTDTALVVVNVAGVDESGNTLNLTATSLVANNLRATDGNLYFQGIGIDSVTGKFYASHDIADSTSGPDIWVYSNAAAFELGGSVSTVNLTGDIHGTYFTAVNDQLIGRAGASGTEVQSWNAASGAVHYLSSIPGMSGLNGGNGGFDWGGYTSVNILQSDEGVFALGKPQDGQWTVAELDPTTLTVTNSNTFNLSNDGYAFIVDEFIFFGEIFSGSSISQAYNVNENTLSPVNITLATKPDYLSNMAYDSASDSLYYVDAGEIYEVEDVSDLLFT